MSPTDGSDASPVGSLSRRSYGYPVETMKVEHGGSAVGGPHIANNIGRKRLFGELSADPGTSSVSLVHERNVYPQCKIISQDFKKSNLTKNGLKTTQSLVSDSEKNVEVDSRTVLVTNIRFKAIKEALSLFFANCGGVVNVVMLTDILTANRQRAAYVTFANEESVDKAVALSGTTFYSRTVKVLRKAEAASAATAPAQLSAKPFHAHGNRKAIPNKPRYPSSSLQWRREPSTDPTEAEQPSAPASVEVVSSSAPKHLSDTDKEGNASSTERAATRST